MAADKAAGHGFNQDVVDTSSMPFMHSSFHSHDNQLDADFSSGPALRQVVRPM